MRFGKASVLFGLFLSLSVTFAEDDLGSVTRHVADAQRRLPWFWGTPLEGLADVPYTYEMNDVRQHIERPGKPARSTLAIRMERIALDGGSYYRCLMQDGAAPCSETLTKELEVESNRWANFSAGEKAKAKAVGEARRRQRAEFWSEFPKAFQFQRVGPAQVHFTPTSKYRPQPGSDLLAKIKGDFWFDPRTFEITRMQYDVLEDIGSVVRLRKGSSFSITLAENADHRYLPTKVTIIHKLAKGGVEDHATDFTNYRRFTTDSSVQFVLPDKPERN